MKPHKCECKLGDFLVAPYNFISFPSKIVSRYKSIEELPKHNSFKDEDGNILLNGYIGYEIEAKTPIMINDGEKTEENKVGEKETNFFKNAEGKYAIPGNSIRGLVRTNSQILSNSPVVRKDYSEIDDKTFLYRAIFGNTTLAKKYQGTLNIKGGIAKNLRTGYIYNKNGKYHIEESEELIKNREDEKVRAYFRVNELEFHTKKYNLSLDEKNYMYNKTILRDKNEIEKLNKVIGRNNYIIKKESNSLLNKDDLVKLKELMRENEEILNKKFENFLDEEVFCEEARRNKLKEILKNNNKQLNSKREEKYKGYKSININKEFKPYCKEISFSYNEKNHITEIDEKDKLKNNGFILTPNFMTKRKTHYIIPSPTEDSERIDLSSKDIENYKNDLVLTKKAEKTSSGIEINKDSGEMKSNKFYFLPEEGKRKPVFFIRVNDEVHFGFTPFLRIKHSKSILDGISDNYKNINGISYTESIFGFTNIDKKSYKTRISFEDAIVVDEGELDKASSQKLILAEPKATSYMTYLKQGNNTEGNMNIYEENFELRGIKKYWLKNYIDKAEAENLNKNMAFKINPLKEGTKFEGKIHFSNLHEDELGLVLWSLMLEENSNQNIGLAKSYGYGRIQINNTKLCIENTEVKYKDFTFVHHKEENVNEYIDEYKEYFSKKYLKGKLLEEQTHIKELKEMTSTILEEKDCNYYRYLSLKEFSEVDKDLYLPEVLKYESAIKGEYKARLVKDFSKDRKGNGNKNNNKLKKDNSKSESYKKKPKQNSDNRKNINKNNQSINNELYNQLKDFKPNK